MKDSPPDAVVARELKRLDRLAELLDSAFVVPGTRWRFGVDALLGLIPGLGDVAGGVLSCYLIFRAWRLGIAPGYLVSMLGNVVLEVFLGAVPVAGDLFDAWFKANRRNMRLLRRALQQNAEMRKRAAGGKSLSGQ
ncbi:DUF4112 domain-containing protein [Motiliproteus sp. SC1-56]|uniref:DUF4112 domain-containing protein n=1 Tax=Motiliproteus sp. SC1-56 TaxID=2799565 RepID=UPI001A8C87A7|nr:DUF4112 domain-containing protein [Motiliproteus sp. SC1-56]